MKGHVIASFLVACKLCFSADLSYPLTRSSGVLAVQSHRELKIHMFRSYYNPTQPNIDLDRKLLRLNLNDQKNERIYEVAHATSGAPYYFRSINISGLKYLDGGLIANNPTKYAWAEANSMHLNHPSGECPSHGLKGGIRYLVSVGTGKRAEETIKSGKIRKALSIFNRGVQSITDPEAAHVWMEENVPKDDIYYRFNVEHGLENMKLDDCRIGRDGHNTTSHEIQAAVATYLRDGEIRGRLEKLAKQLVQNRRQKCKPQDRSFRDLCVPGPLDRKFDDRFDDSDGHGHEDVLSSPIDTVRSRAGSVPWLANGVHELHTPVPEMSTSASVPELDPRSPPRSPVVHNDTPFQHQEEFSMNGFPKSQPLYG
jgi:hypothetical protein